VSGKLSEEGVFLVTGAARGIGLACAEELARRGESVLLCDLQGESLNEATARMCREGAQVQSLVVDVTRKEDLEKLANAVQRQGGLAGCVHAAGLGGTMASWQSVIKVNLGGTVELLNALLPVTNVGAAIVCIASQAAHFWASAVTPEIHQILADTWAPDTVDRLTANLGVETLDGGTAYGLSKYGVLQIVHKRAHEFGQRGARLISLSPGIIETPMAQAEMKEHQEAMQAIIDNTPVGGRRGRPEEIAAVAVFLCSPAASFVSGVDILVDGGSTQQVLLGTA